LARHLSRVHHLDLHPHPHPHFGENQNHVGNATQDQDQQEEEEEGEEDEGDEKLEHHHPLERHLDLVGPPRLKNRGGDMVGLEKLSIAVVGRGKRKRNSAL